MFLQADGGGLNRRLIASNLGRALSQSELHPGSCQPTADDGICVGHSRRADSSNTRPTGFALPLAMAESYLARTTATIKSCTTQRAR